ncbi:MAG TPA: DNA-binding domain-containing protein [Paraburkholderia sp.]|nr:DNA-binding domain-containing protein [Paraburkholderia sp.]
MNARTPSLIELQQAMRRSLLDHADEDAAASVLEDGIDSQARLNIYRNTASGVLVNALRLAFPAVRRLVGEDFFEGATRLFCSAAPPQSAWLDEYGAAFPAFLAQMPQIASIPYVADVAQLEWQVNGVLHAPDVAPLDLACFEQLDEDALGALRFQPHPAARLLSCESPAHIVWRAVLEQDDAALRAVDLADSPVHLLVQRVAQGVDTLRLNDGEWRIGTALFAGEAVSMALSRAPEAEGYALLGACLARGCFTLASQRTAHDTFDEESPS